MDELAALVVAFCDHRSLDLDAYVEGLLSGGPLPDHIVETLIRYHREWLR